MTDTATRSRLSGAALVSFVLGVLSLGLLVLTGLPALLLGLHSLREINRSEGRLKGKWLAAAAMGLGALGCLMTVVGLLLAARSGLQADSERAACQNNLRLIGSSLENDASKHKRYPSGTLPQDTLPPEQRLSWMVSLLPFLKQESVYSQVHQDHGWNAEVNRQAVDTSLRVFRCPADTERPAPQTPGLTNYVGMAGVGVDAARLPAENPRAGFFGYERTIDQAAIASRRGFSATLIALETRWEIGPWAAGGIATVRGLDPKEQPYIGPGRPFGGLHRGGLNVLHADGAVHFLSESIDPVVFEASATLGEP